MEENYNLIIKLVSDIVNRNEISSIYEKEILMRDLTLMYQKDPAFHTSIQKIVANIRKRVTKTQNGEDSIKLSF